LLLCDGKYVRRSVDLGKESPYEGIYDKKTKREIMLGNFNLDSLKYFNTQARLNV
jgi:hypothetical protein